MLKDIGGDAADGRDSSLEDVNPLERALDHGGEDVVQRIADVLTNIDADLVEPLELDRAQRAGVGPQQYYDQLVRSGVAPMIYGDVRRGKTLATILERVVIEDTNGVRLSLADLRGPADEHDDHDDHEGHEGHDHD